MLREMWLRYQYKSRWRVFGQTACLNSNPKKPDSQEVGEEVVPMFLKNISGNFHILFSVTYTEIENVLILGYTI